MTTFVLVHGAWHGGWCWRYVHDILQARGHRVLTPTQTGLGERSHLISKDIDLETFVTDIENVLIFNDLEDVVLVGHSFAGAVISAVGERQSARIRQLIFLDAVLLENGETGFSALPQAAAAERLHDAEVSSAGISMPIPSASDFGLSDPEHIALFESHATAHPLGTYQTPLMLKAKPGAGLKCTYVTCTDPIYGALEASRERVRDYGWPTEEIAAGHDLMIIRPRETADLLVRIAQIGS